MSEQKKIKILVTGHNGECLPPPYGGIIKRCLLHAKQWKGYGAEVIMHIYYKHENEQDLDAGAVYFYDFHRFPALSDKILFTLKNFSANPVFFIKLLLLQNKLSGEARYSNYLFSASRAILLDKMVRKYKPDVIVTETGNFQSVVALEVAKKYRIPVVMENYAEIQFIGGKDNSNVADKYAKMWEYLVNGVDLVVPASVYCAKGPDKYLADKSKLQVVYSGINFDIFNGHITNDKSAARIKFGLTGGKFLVMAVGALRMRKGHDQLFEAILKIPRAELEKIEVVLCGMGDIEELKARAKDIGFPLDSLKVFQGLSEEDLAQLYSAVDMFCFPSITPRECMGMAMKEAMAMGLPLAAYDTGGISEAIEEGSGGYLAPTGDRDALARAIVKMMALDPETRKRMGEYNIGKSRQLFDIRKTARQLYDGILSVIK